MLLTRQSIHSLSERKLRGAAPVVYQDQALQLGLRHDVRLLLLLQEALLAFAVLTVLHAVHDGLLGFENNGVLESLALPDGFPGAHY